MERFVPNPKKKRLRRNSTKSSSIAATFCALELLTKIYYAKFSKGPIGCQGQPQPNKPTTFHRIRLSIQGAQTRHFSPFLDNISSPSSTLSYIHYVQIHAYKHKQKSTADL